jgi:DNA sulfur modification protein DndB
MGESIFGKSETDLNLEERTFATLKAIKGRQFGKDVYSSVIKFEDLSNFLEIFPSVQRDIIQRKVGSLRRYILSGLEKDNSVNMRFFSAVTVTCKGTIYYTDASSRMGIDIYESKLSINDGQHRFEAIKTAIEYLEQEFVKSKDKMKTARIKEWLDELKNMVIPVVIFDGLTEREEKQLFHDLNNLAQRPSRNANIRLNQTDLFSKMARELATENKYFKHYGVEMDKMSIHPNNENTILLSTIYASIKEILGSEYKYNHGFLNDKNYQGFKKRVEDTFNKLFFVLPPDIDTKGKYLTEKSYAIRAISRFICHARNHLDLQLSDDDIFGIIKGIDWSYDLDKWSLYGGMKGSTGTIVFGGGSGGGFRAVYSALMDKATSIDNDSKQEEIEFEDEKVSSN